ncbi:MAG: G-D-S-L family lipolytic protein [Clostridia bacterium]|nr:G-D-S-L family lipolytic protein [Clostridia bacterium]
MKKKIFISIISIVGASVIALSLALGIYLMTKQPSYWQAKYDEFVVENRSAKMGQIVFLGDSITDFCPLENYYSDLSLKTYNRGIGGDTTLGILKRLDVSLFDIRPSKIVLMIGINDINSGRTVDEIAESYSNILNQIKTRLPETQVYCMSVLPMSDKLLEVVSIDLTERNNQVIALNEKINELANGLGYSYLDLFSLVSTSENLLKNELTDDGIHLNNNGFTIWANLVKPYLA